MSHLLLKMNDVVRLSTRCTPFAHSSAIILTKSIIYLNNNDERIIRSMYIYFFN